jgi:hypothetical protein
VCVRECVREMCVCERETARESERTNQQERERARALAPSLSHTPSLSFSHARALSLSRLCRVLKWFVAWLLLEASAVDADKGLALPEPPLVYELLLYDA